MSRATSYHRPDTVEQALALLTAEGNVALAGGTLLNADDDPTPVGMVDLQGLGLTSISVTGDQIELGAMVTLHDLRYNGSIPPVVGDAARAELPRDRKSVV